MARYFQMVYKLRPAFVAAVIVIAAGQLALPFAKAQGDQDLTIETTSPLPQATVGVLYELTLQPSGGAGMPPVYAWTNLTGPIPPISPAGLISFTPSAAGTINFTVELTDGTDTVTKAFSLIVAKATPVITWGNPAAITYPTPLGAPQLNATANVAGTFVYTPPAGTVLPVGTGQNLHVDFTPTDATNYNNASADVTIDVLKGTPLITWGNPGAITYPTPLGAPQLNATANVPGTFVYTPPGGTVLPVGTAQNLHVDFTPTDAANYNNASADVTIDVSTQAVVITWGVPADITYPAPLGAAQLNATANVAGTFVYTPPAGTVLPVGVGQNLHVDFTPSDPNFDPASKDVPITVLKGTPVITWGNPAAITYPTPLGAAQLNATANVAGTFVYTPPAGTVLPVGTAQNLHVDFTPTDTTNYNTASADVTIDVSTQAVVITWGGGGGITYPTPLGAAQLNATANVAGTFVYTPPAGTVLPVGVGQNLHVDFTPSDPNFDPASKDVPITVLKGTPVITWGNPAAITYPTPLGAAQLNATANVAGTFVYTPPAGTALPVGTGQNLHVDFTPTDSANYNSIGKDVAINVLLGVPDITWIPPGAITYPAPLGATQLNATANVAGTFVYTPPAGTVLSAGTGQNLHVDFTPSDPNYGPASTDVPITVLKGTPLITWNSPGNVAYPTPLGATQLNATSNVPGTFAYTPPAGTVLPVGTGQNLHVDFTPTDQVNYNTAARDVTINVLSGEVLITWAGPGDITYPAPLGPTQLNATANVAGTFVYTPPAGTVLPVGTGQNLHVDFTPSDPNFDSESADVTINVLAATPVITWNSAGSITYPAPLGPTQLNATANVAGTFVYTPGTGTVLNAGAGQNLHVDFTSADPNYGTASADVTINVARGTPIVTWPNPSPITHPTPLGAAQLNATANVAGTFVYTPSAGTTLPVGQGQLLTVNFTPNDSNYDPASAQVSISVNPDLNINAPNLPPGTVGVPYARVLAASGGTPPFVWSVSQGLPPGLQISPSSGAITGIPTGPGSGFSVTVTDAGGGSNTIALSITINPPPSITTSNLPAATEKVAYTAQLTATGGTPPLTWFIPPSALPPGLALNTATGLIQGTPSVPGTFNFSARVTDSLNAEDESPLSIEVIPELAIVTTALQSTIVDIPYSATLTATGGRTPYVWSLAPGSQPLPPGLALSSAGTISGTPTQTGAIPFTVRVSSSDGQAKTKTLAITINETLIILTQSLPEGTVGRPYSASFTGIGGVAPLTWEVIDGSLPAGLTLDPSTGTINGIPTESGEEIFLTARLTDSGIPSQTAVQPLIMTIIGALRIDTAQFPNGVAGDPYAWSATASGGVPPYRNWNVAAGALPAGLSINPIDGEVTGTPTVSGTASFTLEVLDSAVPPNVAARALSIRVQQGRLVISPASLPDGVVGGAYSQALSVEGGISPHTWSLLVGTLPPGVSLSSNGTIQGVPNSAGDFTFTVEVSDGEAPSPSKAIRKYTVSILPSQTLRVLTQTLPDALQGTPYSGQLAAVGGVVPYRWAISSGDLPAGLNLTPDGRITGTSTRLQSSSFTATVTDARNDSRSRDLVLIVRDPSAEPIPTLSLGGMPGTANPARQIVVELAAANSPAVNLTGTLGLRFEPNAVVAGDDPTVQFSNGTRSVLFTIPSDGTSAQFPSGIELLTGTVAGTIYFTADLEGQPAPLEVGSITIPRLPPQVSSVATSRTGSTIEVRIIGYSPEKSVSAVGFRFNVRIGTTLRQVELSRNVGDEFAGWYQDGSSAPFGSTFLFIQSFTVGGDPSSIESVVISLTNGQGTTFSQTTPIPTP